MAESTYAIFEIAAGTGMLGTGIAIALESLGIRSRVVGGCEREATAAAAFLASLEISQGGGVPVWDDATTLFGRRVRGLESVDVVCAGYPCQPFSSAGKRLGKQDSRHLWPAVRRIVARLKPRIVFFENVDGHVTKGLRQVIRDTERLGYQVACGVFSAEEVGATHLRKRVFILGKRLDNTPSPRRNDQGQRSNDGEQRGRQCVPESGREAMADAPRIEQRQRQRLSKTSGDGSESGAEGHGEELAYESSERLSGNPQQNVCDRSKSPRRRNLERCNAAFPLFPPHRDAYTRWAELAANGLDQTNMPAIESGVSVVADGMASPADLLRLGGNGVVPLQAAWAFINIFACLMDGMEAEEPRQLALFDS